MGDDRISVIVPCYNVENMVGECLESIIGQSIGLSHLEIILVDDASTDGTVQILKEYEKRYPDNIMLILCDENGRQGTARNIGLSYATGEYISFVDSDDWIHKDMYKVLVDIMEKNDCDIVQFRYRETMQKPDDFTMPIQSVDYKLYDYASGRKEFLLNSCILNESCTTKLYRRSLLDRAKVKYAEKVAYEEPLFTYPLKFYVNRAAVTEAQLYYYRYNENGTMISYMNNPSTMVQHLQVQLDVYIRMMNSEFMKDYKDEIDLYFIHSFYAETFYFMAVRNMPMMPVMLRYMIKVLVQYLPDYRSNPYINMPGIAHEMECLKLIDMAGLSDEKLGAAAAEYMSGLKEE